MIQRDGQMQQQQAMQQQYQQQQMAAAVAAPNGAMAAQPSAQVVMPTTPAPAVTVIGGSDYPYYDYGYPDYYGYGGAYLWLAAGDRRRLGRRLWWVWWVSWRHWRFPRR